MWAIRKLRREPGLALDEVPVPRIRDDDVLVRVEAASLCGTDLHIFHWDEWARHRIRPPVTLGHGSPGVVEVGRNVRHTSGRFRFRREPCDLRDVLRVPHGAGAHVRADADPRRRPGRRLRRVRRRPGVCDLAQRPHEAPAGDRNAAGAVRERRLRDGPPRPGRAHGGDPRLRAGGAFQHCDRARLRRRASSRPTESPSASTWRARWESPTWSTWTQCRMCLPGSWDGTRASISTSSSRMSGAPSAIGDAFRIARNGGHVVLFGIPARPVEIDVAESLIFKNLSVTAVSGRRIFETWYKTRWLLEHGIVDLRPLITHRCALVDFTHALESSTPGARARSSSLRRRDRGRGRDCSSARAAAGGVGSRARGLGAPMNERLREELAVELEGLRQAGTYKRFLTLRSPQGPSCRWRAAGRCSCSRRTTTSGSPGIPR